MRCTLLHRSNLRHSAKLRKQVGISFTSSLLSRSFATSVVFRKHFDVHISEFHETLMRMNMFQKATFVILQYKYDVNWTIITTSRKKHYLGIINYCSAVATLAQAPLLSGRRMGSSSAKEVEAYDEGPDDAFSCIDRGCRYPHRSEEGNGA